MLISAEWPTLLKHFVRNEILWQGRTVICLEPIRKKGKRKLRIVEINRFFPEESSSNFPSDAIGGLCLSLYDHERRGLDRHVASMRAAGMVMASQGNALKSHGFAFLWQDPREGMAPYCFTIANIASFQLLGELLVGSGPYRPTNLMHKQLLDVVKIHEPDGHGLSLHAVARRGSEFLHGLSPRIDHAGQDWDDLKQDMDDHEGGILGFYAWGFFADAFHERLRAEYERGKRDTAPDCPRIGRAVVDKLIDGCVT
ncbi:hypothetical protein PAN31108_02238 [Pandoraea anhela]|uniref:Uncharacterized protein n=1 Tax=Pandoraea anhela TaxID=2508295 RepID=A0A5E4USY8_9BURK|nr:hypothetical protein PAN31108_02238 [Pandoraea anhela]